MTGTMRAYVYRDQSDWMANTVHLYLIDQHVGGYSALMPDGTWRDFPEAESAIDAGLRLPAASVVALREALDVFEGNASHAETEARVLREWLAVERERVDKALAR